MSPLRERTTSEHVIINTADYVPAFEGPRLEIVFEPAGGIRDPRDRLDPTMGSLPFSSFEQSLQPGDRLEWCTVTTTGAALIWTAREVTATALIRDREVWVRMVRSLASLRYGKAPVLFFDHWIDFHVDLELSLRFDAPEARLSGKRGGRLLEGIGLVDREAIESHLDPSQVQAMAVFRDGVIAYTPTKIMHLYFHLGTERIVILPRHPGQADSFG